jgi:hypothetical protein
MLYITDFKNEKHPSVLKDDVVIVNATKTSPMEQMTIKNKRLSDLWKFTVMLKNALEPMIDDYIAGDSTYLTKINLKRGLQVNLLFPEIKNDSPWKMFLCCGKLRSLQKYNKEVETYVRDVCLAIHKKKTGKVMGGSLIDIIYSDRCYTKAFLESERYQLLMSKSGTNKL